MKFYIVVFVKENKNNRKFINYFLNKNFCHCFLLEELEENKVLQIDATRGGIELIYHKMKVIDVLKDLRDNNLISSIILIDKEKNYNTKYYCYGIYSCVSIIKAILKIRNAFVLTPYHLYKYLLRKRVN